MDSLKFSPGSNMHRPNVRYRQQAFTLIELLVVISVILIAASIVVVTGRGGSGAALSSSTRIVSSIAQGARGQAILQNARARMIIYANADLNTTTAAEEDKYLRFFGIVYSEDDGNTWRAATQGTFLPRGIYFDPELSADVTGSTWSQANTMTLDFPRSIALPSGSETYYYYEFEPNGRARDPNAWLVIRAATLRPGSTGRLSVEFPGANEDGFMLKAALIIRQAGTATIVTNPSEID
jgi:prepilin-type N-terminal cleavage/methylation domain-containing protein